MIWPWQQFSWGVFWAILAALFVAYGVKLVYAALIPDRLEQMQAILYEILKVIRKGTRE